MSREYLQIMAQCFTIAGNTINTFVRVFFDFCIFHHYIDVKTQTTRTRCYGFMGAEMPGLRLVQLCDKCGKKRFIKLNLMVPDHDMKLDHIWKDC